MESPPPLDLQLRDKALLALEDAVQECRYRTPRPSFAVRFALAWLWASSGVERDIFDEFWRCLLSPRSMWSFSVADAALMHIYVALGVERPHEIQMTMWRRWEQHERDRKAGPKNG